MVYKTFIEIFQKQLYLHNFDPAFLEVKLFYESLVTKWLSCGLLVFNQQTFSKANKDISFTW